jgi:hypothetical protein
MNAPKKIWYDDQECSAGPVQFNSDEVKYIRADLVDRLVEALEFLCASVEPSNTVHPNSPLGKARAALKALEEE